MKNKKNVISSFSLLIGAIDFIIPCDESWVNPSETRANQPWLTWLKSIGEKEFKDSQQIWRNCKQHIYAHMSSAKTMDVQLIYLHDKQLINNKQRLFLYSTVSIRDHQGFPQKLFLMTIKFPNQKSSLQHHLPACTQWFSADSSAPNKLNILKANGKHSDPSLPIAPTTSIVGPNSQTQTTSHCAPDSQIHSCKELLQRMHPPYPDCLESDLRGVHFTQDWVIPKSHACDS